MQGAKCTGSVDSQVHACKPPNFSFEDCVHSDDLQDKK